MRTLIITSCLSILLSTAGCSSNPPKGQGGIAEHNAAQYPDHQVGLENALYFEQQLSQRHLDSLIIAGAKICFPASVKTAQIREARIARELQGGLKTDAANDLIVQRDQLTRLERRLNYVQMQESCLTNANNSTMDTLVNQNKRPTQAAKLSKQVLTRINMLLNNNNQFVTNSAALNPRYIGQLSEVAQLLRSHPQYQLKITGHTDSQGNAADNLTLSLQRAAQVERYLQIFGISPNNIQVSGSGAKQPLFTQDLPQVRLVNRRVSIEVIDTNSDLEG